ncbi:MAG: hypothetical protein WDN28_23700 [Chthoniobacter sp.]
MFLTSGTADFCTGCSDHQVRRAASRSGQEGLPLCSAGGLVARIGRAHVHPLLEIGDDLVVEFRRFRRQLQIGIFVTDRLDEQAFRGFAGHDGIAGIASFFPAVAIVEPQAALVLGGAVALVAFGGEHGADFRLEEFASFGGDGRVGGTDGDAKRQQSHRKEEE